MLQILAERVPGWLAGTAFCGAGNWIVAQPQRQLSAWRPRPPPVHDPTSPLHSSL